MEIAGKAGTDITNWEVAGIGSSGTQFSDEQSFATTIPDSGDGFGYIWVTATTASTFKGSAGAVLLDASDNVIDFIAWDDITPHPGSSVEGATPTDVPVTDGNAGDTSIQLGGTGSFKTSFTWQTTAARTDDAINTGQTMEAPGDNVCDGAFACVNSCADTVQDLDETDTDCGGVCGATCAVDQDCLVDDDCVSDSCGAGDTCEP